MKQRNVVTNLIVTKIGMKHPYAVKMMEKYKAKNEPPVQMIPDWVVFSKKGGKTTTLGRYKGCPQEAEILKRLTTKKPTRTYTPRRTLWFRR